MSSKLLRLNYAFNQNQTQCCVGCATAIHVAKRFGETLHSQILSPTFSHIVCKTRYYPMSCNQTNVDPNNPSIRLCNLIPTFSGECGVRLNDVVNMLTNLGIPYFSTFGNPLGCSQFRSILSSVYTEALNKSYAPTRVMPGTIVTNSKYVIDNFNTGLVCMFTIYDSFYEYEGTGFIKPVPYGNNNGLHCMEIMGYNDELQHTYPANLPHYPETTYTGFVLCQNSWGNWADLGCCWIPYDVLESWIDSTWVCNRPFY